MKKTEPKGKAKDPDKLRLGRNILLARTDAKMSQLALAHKIGLTGEDAGACISRWESGTYEPRLDTIARIADALNVAICDLLNGPE